ncbi:hypothetical protein, partial [Draconibacterium sediminis]|uniref:hypothetical protein n=1 Tax=Draconibacterium sediminis TaxID=1544798 RepID=UPI0012F81D4E
MKRLMYIVFFLMIATNLLAQESYVIDSVCVGTERTYGRDGEEGYTYHWEIIDHQLNDTFPVASVPFEVDLGTDTIYGSESTILWDTDGDYDIRVYVTSEHGCDTVQQGMVRVFPLPEARAGDDVVLCSFDDYTLFGDTAWNHSQIYWGRTGDGTFSNEYSLHPTYTFGPNDILNGEVTLFITAEGLADNGTCIPAVDSVTIKLLPQIEIREQLTVCESSLPYNWNGVEIFAAGTYSDSLTSAGGCDSILVLELFTVPEFRDTVFETVCESSLPYKWNGMDIASAGTYTDSMTSVSGCDSILVLELFTVPEFRDTIFETVCESSLPYNWNGIDIASAGTYMDSLTSAGG